MQDLSLWVMLNLAMNRPGSPAVAVQGDDGVSGRVARFVGGSFSVRSASIGPPKTIRGRGNRVRRL